MQERVRGLYAYAFRDRYRGAFGSAFQDLFSEIMEHVYPDGDFVRVRPWGNVGDQKNDGYIRSSRQLFAVYGPHGPTATEVCSKVTSDYEGAVPHWEEWFEEFIFVHNDPDGVGPQLARTILELDARVDDLSVTQWGMEPLQTRALNLDDDRLRLLFPDVPTIDDFFEPSMPEIERVIEQLARSPLPADTDVRPPPPDKLDFNGFSDDVRSLFFLGMKTSPRVGLLFQPRLSDPTARDRIAAAFRAKYANLRSAGLYPDQIYDELRTWVGGVGPKPSSREVAVYGILSYFFEECDIFLRPEEVGET
ncbi:MAG: ABC-three component system protein [Acidimicrobiia bacterium]